MLLLGTDDFFAFWMASYSVGLPAGSPPPVRAATSMFLISLANILPRLASTTAFLCLVVAHLEWPDMRTSSSNYRAAIERLRSGRDPRTAGAAGGRHPPPGGTTSPAAVPAGPRRSYRRPVRP